MTGDDDGTPMFERDLTEKQRRFVEAYMGVANGNASAEAHPRNRETLARGDGRAGLTRETSSHPLACVCRRGARRRAIRATLAAC